MYHGNISQKKHAFNFLLKVLFIFQQPLVGHDLFIVEVSRPHHIRQDYSGRVIGPTQTSLPDNIQHSHETDIHATGGNRTRNHSKRAGADPCLRGHGQWERLLLECSGKKISPITITVFRDVTKCSLLVGQRCQGRLFCIHFQRRRILSALQKEKAASFKVLV